MESTKPLRSETPTPTTLGSSMTTRRVDSDGNPTNYRTKRGNPPDQPFPGNAENNPQFGLFTESDREMLTVLRSFSELSHGYLKLRRSSPGDDIHCTWTWTLTRHSGCYVYVRGPFWQLGALLEMLHRKMAEVDNGERKPSPDKYSS